MNSRFLFIIFSALTLIGCKTAEVYHFTHESTESNRKSLQWSQSYPKLATELSTSELPYLVVDFHTFWPGYSTMAYLYVVQLAGDPIELRSISVSSAITSEDYAVFLNVKASPEPLDNGLHLYRYRVIDTGASKRFIEADSLQVKLKWVDKDNAERVTEFELKRQMKKEVAWPT